MNDPYKILGVSRNASTDEIKKAYRKLAHKTHPDTNPGDKKAEEKFKEINDAYQQITNPQPQGNPHSWHPGGMDNFSSGIFDEIFKGFSGGVNHVNRSRNINVVAQISFKESCFGVTKEISFTGEDLCNKCNGVGGPKDKVKVCKNCNGTGSKQKTYGFVIMSGGPCKKCDGIGKIFEEKCIDCKGKGTKYKRFTKQVKIPPCITPGQSLLIRGGGDKGKNGISGDLYISLNVGTDPKMTREGINISSRVSIPLREALLGTQVDIDTLHGPVVLKINECTKQGAKLRLSQKGAKIPNNQKDAYGDHIVIVDIEFPKTLTDKQKEIIKEL